MAWDWPIGEISPPPLIWPRVLAAIFPESQHVPSHADPNQEHYYLQRFEVFFREYESRVTGYLWRMTHDETSACDLSQETFLRAWQAFERIETYVRPQSWLFQVATHLALHHLRQARKPLQATLPLESVEESWQSDPIPQFIEQHTINEILASLSFRARAALVMREIYGFPCEDIGVALGISRNAAKMTLSRARAQFRQLYTEE